MRLFFGLKRLNEYNYDDMQKLFKEIAYDIYEERLRERDSSGIRFHRCLGGMHDDADERFDIEANHLMDEIRKRVELLHQKGIGSYVM